MDKQQTILIVDDSPDNLKVLGKMLDSQGYHIRVANSGMMALENIKLSPPDLVLLDIMMPGMNGYEVCMQLKSNPDTRDIPIVFLTALSGAEDEAKGLKMGAIDYISKPFKLELIRARVQNHLELKSSRDELAKLVEERTRELEISKVLEKQIKKKNEELSAVNEEKDKFFSIIAHDLRSPFNAFLGFTEMMTENLQTLNLEEIQQVSELMRKSALDLFGLLENLLEWSRMQRGVVNMNPEKLYLKEILDSIMQIITDLARKKEINISLNISNGLMIYADPHQLESALRNICTNAVKFTQHNGNIEITAIPHLDRSVEISVKDSGIGMSKEILRNLFKLNNQFNRKGTDGESSTGLGLMIVKDIIDKHGGRLHIESEVDKGTNFTIIFPGETGVLS